ncbi:helix-turn-helix transcriptional regulator [Plantactinospora sp. B6F1]|uniref:helix-turn-helix transcriptional regulator n=1 Tax=Plantactinospora sp. B6F1 TaxID=3158971 RepID=UPI0032D90196
MSIDPEIWEPEWYGQQLKERRELVGLTQAEVGKLAAVHRGTIRNVELGRPLELRTHTNVRRILGLTPHPSGRPPRPSDPMTEVLTPATASAVARTLLSIVDGRVGQGTVNNYLGIIADVAHGRLHETQWDLLKVSVADLMPREQGEALLAEVRAQTEVIASSEPMPSRYETSWAERAEEVRQLQLGALLGDDAGNTVAVTGLDAGVPRPVMSLILRADVPDEAKMRLMQHAAQRARQMEESLISEVRLLVEQMQR